MLFLDLDGTLVDSLPGIEFSIRAAFSSIEKAVPAVDLRRLIGPGIRVILGGIDPSLEGLELEAAERSFRRNYDSVGCLQTRLFPEVRETLARLQSRCVQMFIITNKPLKATTAILNDLEIASFFVEVLTRDSVAPPYQSKAEMIEYLLSKHKVHRSDALVVGDTPEDKEAAEEIQIKFVFAAYGYGHLAERTNAQISVFSDLTKVFNE